MKYKDLVGTCHNTKKLFLVLEKQVESTNHGGMLKEKMGADMLLTSLNLMCSYKILVNSNPILKKQIYFPLKWQC